MFYLYHRLRSSRTPAFFSCLAIHYVENRDEAAGNLILSRCDTRTVANSFADPLRYDGEEPIC